MYVAEGKIQYKAAERPKKEYQVFLCTIRAYRISTFVSETSHFMMSIRGTVNIILSDPPQWTICPI